MTRSVRTLYTVCTSLPSHFPTNRYAVRMITLDCKWNLTPEKSDQIPALHARVANQMYRLFTAFKTSPQKRTKLPETVQPLSVKSP